ncbi:MAG: hypothetical protein ABSF52_17225 [Syntrophobacteraceae bacterium]|jgi:hypothetical protein
MKKKIFFALIGMAFFVAISAVTYHRVGAGETPQAMQESPQKIIITPCAPGLSPCGKVCKNLGTDPQNCGACGNVCAAGMSCVSGACTNQTMLLFSFVTNQNGFDTGISISNTSMDPFGTPQESGGCSLYFFSGGSSQLHNTGSISAGAQWDGVTSNIAPGFQGYVIAVCNFRNAHGWAMVSDIGARNLAASAPALVLTVPRPPSEALGQ